MNRTIYNSNAARPELVRTPQQTSNVAPEVAQPVKEEVKPEPAPVEEKKEEIPVAIKDSNRPIDFQDPADDMTDEEAEEISVIEEIGKEWDDAIEKDGPSAATNWDKFGISIPISDSDKVNQHRETLLENNKDNREALMKMASDMSSDWVAVDEATRYFSGAVTCLKEALENVSSKPEDLVEKFKHNIKGRGMAKGKLSPKYTANNVNVLTGDDAFTAFVIETGGIRKLTLWNSGITLTLKNLSLNAISRFFNTVNHSDYHYGREYGGFYYFFADLEITKYIVENLLPLALNGSNYKHFRDHKALLDAISYQDYPIIVWALATMMYPDGATVRYVCSNPSCRKVHQDNIDLEKLRLNNIDLITDQMVEHFKPKKDANGKLIGWIDDSDLEKYREMLGFNKKSVEFDYDTCAGKKHWKVNFKQASLGDFIKVGEEFNADLSSQVSVTSRDEVLQFIGYNRCRCYKPWIKSIELTKVIDGEEKVIVVENLSSGENDQTIEMLLDDFQQHSIEFGDMVKQYIFDTKITHIAFYYPACPDCGTASETSYGGFIPYDPMNAFFNLGLTKLVLATSKSETKKDGSTNM